MLKLQSKITQILHRDTDYNLVTEGLCHPDYRYSHARIMMFQSTMNSIYYGGPLR
jgi:hypothetical protein